MWRKEEIWRQVSKQAPTAMWDCGNSEHGFKTTARNLYLIQFGTGTGATYAYWYKNGGGWHSDTRIYYHKSRGCLPLVSETENGPLPWKYPSTYPDWILCENLVEDYYSYNDSSDI